MANIDEISEEAGQSRPEQKAPRRRRGRWWAAGRIALKSFIVFGAVAAVAATGIADARGVPYPDRDDGAPAVEAISPAADTHDPSKPTAVIVLSAAGTNVADSMAPYQVLSSTEAFNVYTVAFDLEPVTLTGGLDLVPDLTFDELDDLLGATPDVIVVPQLVDSAEPSSKPIEEWLIQQRVDGDPLLMAVCVGAEVLAEAGILDGRPATAHWLKLIDLRMDYPSVDWQDGVRFVDDGDIITTGGVLTGVDGALRVVERMIGAEAAEQAAQAVRWPDYVPGEDVTSESLRPGPPDVVGLLSAGYRFDRPDTGVLITEGIGEIELASAFRPYTELSYLARSLAVTADGGPIQSRHGLTFVPRDDLASAAPDPDRLVVPGADTARNADDLDLPDGLAPVYLHDGQSFPFDGTLRDIADTYDTATARWVAKTLDYPAPDDLTGSAWPWTLSLIPVLIAFAAAAVVALTGRILRRRRDSTPSPAD